MKWFEGADSVIATISTIWLFVEMGTYVRERLPIEDNILFNILFWCLWIILCAALPLIGERFGASRSR